MSPSCASRALTVSGIIVDTRENKAKTVAIVVYEGVAMFEYAVAYEVFGDDHSLGPDVPWYRLLVCGPGPVRLDSGLRIEAPLGLAQLYRADTIVVPPCERPDGPPEEVLQALRRAHARGARLASLCTGA